MAAMRPTAEIRAKRSRRHRGASWLLVVCLASCTSVPTFTPTESFEESSLAFREASGAASISGQAFVRSASGDVKLGAGCRVVLLPDIAWTREWRDKVVVAGMQPTDDGHYARLGELSRSTTADVEGRFRFDKLPAGKWILTCAISWKETELVHYPGPHFFYFHGRGRRGRRGYYRAWPCHYYPWAGSTYEREYTTTAIAHASVELAARDAKTGLVLSR